jgi:nitrite reductase/ring-hydroxylating ferredoxin subunit
MNDITWIPVDGIDPAADAFPQAARIGGANVLVFRLEEGFRAVQRTCPHQHASFTDAQVVGGRMLRCARHGYTFKFSDGKGVNCPGYRLSIYEVVRAPEGFSARAIP